MKNHKFVQISPDRDEYECEVCHTGIYSGFAIATGEIIPCGGPWEERDSLRRMALGGQG